MVEPGSTFKPNPTEFFVKPRSAGGKAMRDTLPGIWTGVYERLIRKESAAMSKWRT
jgi:hypothetical protein